MVKKLVIEIVSIVIAVILASIGLKAFLLPNGFLDGGVTGICILLSELYDVQISLILPIISVPFLMLGAVTLTKRIVVKSVFAILLLSLVLHFENFQPITEEYLIISVFGGLLLGVGIGIAIRNGAVLDGSEILGIHINKKYGISIGTVILVFNIILFGITAFIISVDTAMYSTIAYFVTSKSIDFTIKGFENHVGLMVISQKSNLIQQKFLQETKQGFTIYKGVKGYGKQGANSNIDIIHIVVNRIYLRRVENIIDEIDKSAFIIEFDVNNVKGGEVKRYLT